MLCTLQDVRTRLGLAPATIQYDADLTAMIEAVEGRFEGVCGRKFGRVEGVTQLVASGAFEIAADRYPVENITKFENGEGGIWTEVAAPLHYELGGGILYLGHFITGDLGRITYTGGYYTPDLAPAAPEGSTPLPAVLRRACIEQVVAWYQTREHVLAATVENTGTGITEDFADLTWVPWVRDALKPFRRLAVIG